MDEISDKFYYVYSSSLEQNVQIKIGTLEGKLKKPEYDKLLADPMLKFSGLYQEKCSDLMVVCQVYADNRSFGLPVSTSYKAFTTRWNWNEWITLPIQYCDLPRSAQLALTIYDCEGPNNVLPVGGTTITLFGKHGVFRQGMLDLRVWPNRKADGSVCTCTPGKSRDNEKEQMQRLAKITKRHRNGHITKVDWLDRLTFREVELIHQKEKQNSNYLYLMIEFPEVCIDDVPHAVVYYEPDGDEVYQFRAQADVVTVPDHEILQENLVESKHHKLARSLRSGVSDKDLKPNATVRDMLNNIVAYPPTKQLSNEEQDLVWKFRFYLSNQKKALAKFLKCVNWKVTGEARQALAMLQQWAPMDVEDALELLGPNFNHFAVRRYAVSRLKQAPDEDLLLYLLQLVQALKYENFDEIKEGYKKLSIQDCELINDETEKTKDLIQENVLGDSNEELTLRHSLSCDAPVNEVGGSLNVNATQRAENLTYSLQNFPGLNTETISSECSDNDGFCDLASFLIYRACKNATLANYFYWYLLIECEDQETAQTKQDSKVREMYLTVMRTFSQTLARGSAEWQNRRFLLTKQQNFLDKLVLVIKAVNSSKDGSTKKKTEILQHLLQHGSEDTKMSFANFDPIPFPLDPDIYIKGIIPSKASLYRSALQPSRLTFVTAENEEYVAIFKYGDDLRQDQLVLQIITLMDKLLRRENLDLKLTPYKVLATGTKHGFVQCIDSKNVAMVLTQDGSIQNYFRKFYPSETGPYGIMPEVMDTYVRSCAGYCVITYLLGVGDRHLDNLLLTTNGKLFHIDFGYILGRDPKPLPPPMKLSKEMVDGMGGINSEHYHELRKQCYTAFLHLRRHANLILNLFSLMVDASCPDIALEPDKAVRKVQDNLQLHLSDEEAVHYMQNLLDESVTAVMPALVEQFHKFAQYWRK